ncbi:DUF2161 family putative PD-(D/E)XK-type phosphodiesterase [Gemmobacter serpentinus]|uniref:DUF2161 family putative PD-(D/E)XK-type phosphodiesterase n=1 Tax=Gemmobacter serpentinus TaxID=2652247 RepID=UPI00124C4B68|nr:DUF2161 family putative PD-(D/E)XK-type phosphodiesterase [Gemmobacter serpentinus]
MAVKRREADLYPPLKAYLEGQGFEVKAEIGACDLMAVRGDEAPIIVEMKTGFTLALVMQGVQRQTLFDAVYLAVPAPGKKGWAHRYRDMIALCRRLGLGLLAVGEEGVEAHLDPGPYLPRRQTARAGRLLREFQRRVGDPNTGGTTGIARMTAYRQDALRLLRALGDGPAAPRVLVTATGVARAGVMLRADHYGWFERAAKGVYVLTPKGQAALLDHAEALAAL